MPCYGPLTAYHPAEGSADKRLVFRKDKSHSGIPIKVPCGLCFGCKLEHSRQWALRCMNEKRMHLNSAFLTLTYDNKHLPHTAEGLPTLVLRDLQLFMKRLRKHYENTSNQSVRFFACGEYGETTYRPHYHVLLLSHSFNDLRIQTTGSEYNLYSSATLSELWTAGNSVIGDVTFESAAYVARYCMKKLKPANPHYHHFYSGRTPEFIVMSRRPGIGADYLNKYANEMYAHDNIIVNGVPSSIPRYYDTRYAAYDPACEAYLELLKIARRRKIDRRDNSNRRRVTKELVAMAKLKTKGRTL